MKFGRAINGQIETTTIDRVQLTETELHDWQQIAGVGCWAIKRGGKEVQIQVVADKDREVQT